MVENEYKYSKKKLNIKANFFSAIFHFLSKIEGKFRRL
jgi:hypothetical protein